jgi:hypothetical protein
MLSLAFSTAQAQQLVASGETKAAVAAGNPGVPVQSTGFPPEPSMIRPAVAGTTVEVTGSADQTGPSHFQAKPADILATAGSYGDFTRYLQLFPGVVFNSDVSNDVLVRGGNPLENLYLVDGIEVPNINHITSQGSTGGLTSMIDTAAIGSVDLLTGGYAASYDERLSSIISINPRELGPTGQSHGEAEVGYVGFGGLYQRALPGDGSILLSAHRSLLNLVTSNIGINGVPTYTNGLAQGDWKLDDHNTLSFLSLNGADSLNINPCSLDPFESNLVQTQYGGWRTTNGFHWTRSTSATSTGTLVFSDSEQSENIGQQQQLLLITTPCGVTDINPLYPVLYKEQTLNGMSILGYNTALALTHNLLLTAGSLGKLDRVADVVAQPSGQQSPLSANPAFSDATSFNPHLSTGETGSYAELSLQITDSWSITGGGRLQTYALDGQHTLTPRLRTSLRLGEHQEMHAAYGGYAQLPPSIYFFAFPGNRSLLPIRDTHLLLGGDLYRGNTTRISLEAYRKQYSDYPVSTEYPQLSLANQVDTLGQAFIWLPMVSSGRGLTQGVELSAESRFGSRLFLLENLAYSHSQYTGLDGIYRPGNFDFPIVANLSAIWRSAVHYEASARYEYTSGRPYTPYLLAPSLAQNRGIYDVSQLNGVRGPFYSRLDFQVDRITRIAGHLAYIYAGLNNALDRANFLGYAWEPRCVAIQGCAAADGPYTTVTQMPLYPNFGVRYVF